MSNKMGLIEKFKVIHFWLFHPSRKNILTVSCDLCGSTNIVKIKDSLNNEDTDTYNVKKYTAKYLCMNCKAKCVCNQTWCRINDNTLTEIKNKIDYVE